MIPPVIAPTHLLWQAYRQAGQPYGPTAAGLAQWLREHAHRMERVPDPPRPDPRQVPPL